MDATHFDTLTRILARSPRRQVLRLVSGLGLAILLAHRDSSAKRKKHKKHKKRRGAPLAPPPISPPPGSPPGCTPNCAGKQCGSDGCGGSCGPCAGGTCTAAGICACAAGLEFCGNGCVAACGVDHARDPRDCSCCQTASCAEDVCCSGICGGIFSCVGRDAGEACQFDAQCASERCLGGACNSSCPSQADFCANGTPTCGSNGFCLRPIDGGQTRCGRHDTSTDGSLCNCTSHQDCVNRTGVPGAFCAQVSGASCSCPIPGQAGGTTFCVRPR